MEQIATKQKTTGEITKATRIQALANRAKITSGQLTQNQNALEICLAFDTTGSIYPVFQAGQNAINQIVTELKTVETSVKMCFIAYKNHGDEKYFNGEKPFIATSWTSDPVEISRIMHQIPNAGGGDGLTALEDVLKYLAKDVVWNPHSAKALIIIGDMPPHGVIDATSRCPNNINYNDQIQILKNLGVKIYSVYCDTDLRNLMGENRKKKIQGFYQQIADETGGKCLSLEDISTLITMLLGVCMKETGRMDDFIKKLTNLKQLGVKEEKILKALSS